VVVDRGMSCVLVNYENKLDTRENLHSVITMGLELFISLLHVTHVSLFCLLLDEHFLQEDETWKTSCCIAQVVRLDPPRVSRAVYYR
jgi:hypothetical protein